MGFYIDMKKTDSQGREFREQSPPQVFWTLYGLAGFALTCMGLAAHSLLRTLLNTGDPWDLLLVGTIFSAIPLFILTGIKLLLVRKFIHFEEDSLRMGYRLGKKSFVLWKVPKKEVKEIILINQRPSANVAPVQHEDSQYYIRGHWRLVAITQQNKPIVLDRHTEKGALHSLQNSARNWLSNS